MSVHGIQKLEQEVTRPYRDTVQRLAGALNLSPTERESFEETARRRPRRQSVAHPAEPARDNLPGQATSFVGRQAELTSIAELLAQPDCRLLTLTGPGGIGKTRLAIEAARQQLDAFPNGVHFVPLAQVESPRLLASAIGEALAVSLSGRESAGVQIARFLHDKRVLLVLDNFEHLVEGAGLLVDLLHEPGVKFLVSSRERLNLQEEFLLEVGGLTFPVSYPSEGLRQYTAVDLFAQRARQVQPTFSLDDNAHAVIDICRRLDGLPLGLELAATWLRVMPCRDIARQIERNLDFLVTSMRNVAARHRSLRAVLDHSWSLLPDAERHVLARLSVFRGGFDLEAAEHVAEGSLAALASLVDKSLVRMSPAGRYELQEQLRQYLTEKLAEYDETATVTDRHLHFYLGIAEQAEAQLHGPRQQDWFDRLEIEHDNIGAALSWSLKQPRIESGLRMAGSLGFFWELRSHWYEANDWLIRLVEHATEAPPLVRAKALRFAAVFAEYTADVERARACCQESLSLARQSGDGWSIGWALATMGMYVEGRSDPNRGNLLLQEALSVFRQIGDGWGISHALRRLAINLTLMGESARAKPLLEEALSEARNVGDANALAWSLYLLGNVVWIEGGEVDRASELFEEALSLSPQVRDWSNHMWVLFTLGAATRVLGRFDQAESCYAQVLRVVQDRQVSAHLKWPELLSGALSGLAGVALVRGDPAHAARLFGAASCFADPGPSIFFRLDRQSDMAAARDGLGNEQFETAFGEGTAMTSQQSIAFALERIDG